MVGLERKKMRERWDDDFVPLWFKILMTIVFVIITFLFLYFVLGISLLIINGHDDVMIYQRTLENVP